jgi:predicted SnoaL-like aldol condensation-catalyzing enzyme
MARPLLVVAALFVLAFTAPAGAQQMPANPSMAQHSDQEEANIKVVLDFYDKAINQKDFDAAKVYFGDTYIQHNPGAQDGPEGLKGFLEYLKAKLPDYHNTFKKVFADGDYVIVHVHSQANPDDRGRAIVDIFRLEGGKVVEHWDVAQEIPEKPANDNTMF